MSDKYEPSPYKEVNLDGHARPLTKRKKVPFNGLGKTYQRMKLKGRRAKECKVIGCTRLAGIGYLYCGRHMGAI